MGVWLRTNPLAFLLVLVGVALAVVIAAEVAFSTRGEALAQASAARRAAATEAKLLPPLVAMGAEQEYPESAARPLWTPTRRPAPEQVAAAQNSFQAGQFQLQGVIIVGDERIAMLREKANGKVHRVARGKDVNGIKVAEIQADAVTLAMGAQTEVVPLAVAKAHAAPPAAAAPVPAAQAGPFAAPHAPTAIPGAAPNPLAASAPQGTTPPVAAAPAPQGQPAPAGSPGGAFGHYPAVTEPAGQATTANPLSPEELLARRRARRAQQPQ